MISFPLSRLFTVILITLVAGLSPLAAQQQDEEIVWVQIEAHPSLAEAQERARSIAARIQDVNGFALGGGWYGIVLGPYRRGDAEQVLRVYRAEGRIPRDSYIAFTSSFRQQFYPLGDNILDNPALSAALEPQATPPSEPEVAPQPEVPSQAAPQVSDTELTQDPARADRETLSEARRSEQRLDRDARRMLQTALKAAGFYDAAIDGAFGRGTRQSMRDWQSAQGHEATGVLTTAQRQELMRAYNRVLEGLDLQLVRDDKAGIEMLIPKGVVEFDRYEPPFVHYKASGDLDVRLLMISQRGDRSTLAGLYDIMQTLEIVPLEGPRNRDRNSFTLTGQNDRIVSHTEARLVDDTIKGFTLIWPVGDEMRRQRVLDELRTSFTPLTGALPRSAGAGHAQEIDLVAGLEIRRPLRAGSGVYVDDRGAVLTTDKTVAGCGRVTLDGAYEARTSRTDAATGLALLRPVDRLVPISVARIAVREPRLQSDVAVSGYPYEGVLGAPTLTYGKIADVRGLQGQDHQLRLSLSSKPGDAGGPVFDAQGSVFGILMAPGTSGQTLPDDVSIAIGATAIRAFLGAEGLAMTEGGSGGALDPVDLSRMARNVTVLVNCWE